MDDFLMHHGVKGMKWGVRKKRPVGHAVVVKPPKNKLKKSDSYDASHRAARAKVKAKYLTNEELAAYNKRLQLEKTYNELRPKTASEALMSNLMKFTKAAATNVGQEYAKAYIGAFADATIPKPGKPSGGNEKKIQLPNIRVEKPPKSAADRKNVPGITDRKKK